MSITPNQAPATRRISLALAVALAAGSLPLATPSCNTPAGQNAFMGGIGGAAIGGLIGGRRGAVAGAITGGIIGAAATPDYSHGYYPRRPPRSAYGYY